MQAHVNCGKCSTMAEHLEEMVGPTCLDLQSSVGDIYFPQSTSTVMTPRPPFSTRVAMAAAQEHDAELLIYAQHDSDGTERYAVDFLFTFTACTRPSVSDFWTAMAAALNSNRLR